MGQDTRDYGSDEVDFTRVSKLHASVRLVTLETLGNTPSKIRILRALRAKRGASSRGSLDHSSTGAGLCLSHVKKDSRCEATVGSGQHDPHSPF